MSQALAPMRRIPDPRPLLVPESEVHRKPCLCEETILADPDRRWQGWKVIAAIEATRIDGGLYPRAACDTKKGRPLYAMSRHSNTA